MYMSLCVCSAALYVLHTYYVSSSCSAKAARCSLWSPRTADKCESLNTINSVRVAHVPPKRNQAVLCGGCMCVCDVVNVYNTPLSTMQCCQGNQYKARPDLPR